ncbi:hypothetical protein B0H14DRAFT_3763010 [Mycena olivaceomarginata]|nr:hypothetical protein B0H14DRAFT_3763010 [Mycena olivaceomarginata]
MAAMHGNNGLLQVIATLFWWGSRVEGRRRPRDPEEWKDFIEAVDDITWVLDQLLESGDIGRAQDTSDSEEAGGKKTKRSRGKVGPDVDGTGRRRSKERGGQGSEEAEDELPRPKKRRQRDVMPTEDEGLGRQKRVRTETTRAALATAGPGKGRKGKEAEKAGPKPRPWYKRKKRRRFPEVNLREESRTKPKDGRDDDQKKEE